MSRNIAAFWHKESFNRFINSQLPELLAARVPLTGYHVESTSTYTCRIDVAFGFSSGNLDKSYTDIPQPDTDGVFKIDGKERIVLPIAQDEDLSIAEIKCVGEQLHDFIAERLGSAPPDFSWDASVIKSWFSLGMWVREFFASQPYFPRDVGFNWLNRLTNLRRIRLDWRDQVMNPSYFGRVCPYETPGGPSVGKVLSIAIGAEIRDGKLIIVDDRSEAMLGLGASLVPFIEHNDPNHQQMGIGMQRQSYIPPEPEPALVQTANSFDADGFWCGRNVLTAFVPWGVDTFEDAILISESCANRFDYPHPVEPGDAFANRHGSKGCISRIAPDDEMPHLADGTPVEMVYNSFGVQTRMTVGQLREAIISRVAKVDGEPVIVPSFGAPSIEELRERLKRAGLPENGMEYLTLGKNGKTLDRPSTVGWVYWGCVRHIAREKIKPTREGLTYGQGLSNLEYSVMRNLTVFNNLYERYHTCSTDWEDISTLTDRVTHGETQHNTGFSPRFVSLTKRLALAGIRLELENSPPSGSADGDRTDPTIKFRFEPPEGESLKLARAIPHPWLRQHTLNEIGVPADEDFSENASSQRGYGNGNASWMPKIRDASTNLSTAYENLATVNCRADRMLANDAPESLICQTLNQLETCVREYFHALVTPRHLAFNTRSVFSGRGVIVPDISLQHDQIGIPEEMAWKLFEPMVTREIQNPEAVRKRTEDASQALDSIMGRSWVFLYRAPAITPTQFLAFRPVRRRDNAIHVPPIICRPMNANFDGDQAAVFLPITEAAQTEAGEKLALAAHLERDPGVLDSLLPIFSATRGFRPRLDRDPGLLEALIPALDPMWGLAHLSMTADGLAEISRLTGADVDAPEGFITRNTLGWALQNVLERDGAAKTLDTIQELMKRGFDVAKESGASISPFIGESLEREPLPPEHDEAAWAAYTEEMNEQLATRVDFSNNDVGPQLLAVKSLAQGRLESISQMVVRWNSIRHGLPTPPNVRRSYREGLRPEDLRAVVHRHWEALVRVKVELAELGRSLKRDNPIGDRASVLGRAMRANRPGIVFARAAATGTVDSLTDIDSRMFIGLPAIDNRDNVDNHGVDSP